MCSLWSIEKKFKSTQYSLILWHQRLLGTRIVSKFLNLTHADHHFKNYLKTSNWKWIDMIINRSAQPVFKICKIIVFPLSLWRTLPMHPYKCMRASIACLRVQVETHKCINICVRPIISNTIKRHSSYTYTFVQFNLCAQIRNIAISF